MANEIIPAQVASPGGAGSGRQSLEQLALSAIVVLLPFYRFMELPLGAASIGVVDLLIVGAGGLAVLYGGRRLAGLLALPLLRIGSAGLFLGIVLSLINTVSLQTSVVFLCSLFIKYLLLALVYLGCRNRQILFRILSLYVISNTVSAAMAISQQYGLISIGYDMQSIAGSFDARNEMLYYIVPTAIVCLALILSSRGFRRLGFVCALIILFAATVLSRGRMGLYLELAGLLGYSLFVQRRNRRAWKWVFLLAILTGGALGLLVSIFPDYWSDIQYRYIYSVSNEYGDYRGSTYIRKENLRAVVEAWRSHPFLGIGAGTYQERSAEYGSFSTTTDIQPHNSYLGLLAECGCLALGGVVLVGMSGLHRIFQERLAVHTKTIVHGIGFAYLAILLFMAGFDGLLRYNLWLYLGLIMAATRMYALRQKPSEDATNIPPS